MLEELSSAANPDVSLSQDVTRLLVVEDDYDDFYILKTLLEQDPKRRYWVSLCIDLNEALRRIQQHRFDAVLLDLGLSDSQGLNTLKRIIKYCHYTPIIVLTGVNDNALGAQSIRIGAEDYLPKEELNQALLSRMVAYAIERHRLMCEIEDKAHIDALTRLPDRSALMDRFEVLISNAERSDASLAVVMIDLDGFKAINDNMGHRVGDNVLTQIGARLQHGLRHSDMAARYGGDEFVLLLTNFNSDDDLLTVLKKKHAKLTQPINLMVGGSVRQEMVGASFGIAIWQPGLSAQQLIEMADTAMYQGKKAGKNDIVFYDDHTMP